MKDLLITGCTNYIKDDMLEKLIDDVRVVVAGKNCVHRPGQRFYRTFPGEDSFNQLFDVYSFSSVLLCQASLTAETVIRMSFVSWKGRSFSPFILMWINSFSFPPKKARTMFR